MNFNTDTRRNVVPNKLLELGNTTKSRTSLDLANVVDVEKVN